ncbi:unnamed protein product [Periconia digitata]|uniref:Uncharacterized protein n=1 Tax=Periconia digitata TaxID=1303443 RepID=A0A9W4UN37_9PLEO|nr:unnamed protein product [Periconia digitata]
MVSFSLIAAAAASTLFTSALAGTAYLENNCAYPVWVLGSYSGTVTKIAAGGKYTEGLKPNFPASIKISKRVQKKDEFAEEITQFEYKVDDYLWYDTSFIDCADTNINTCPGWAGGVKISATKGNCKTGLHLPRGTDPTQAYFVPSDNDSVKSCDIHENKGDITMTLCNAKKAKKSLAGRFAYETEEWEEDREVHDE